MDRARTEMNVTLESVHSLAALQAQGATLVSLDAEFSSLPEAGEDIGAWLGVTRLLSIGAAPVGGDAGHGEFYAATHPVAPYACTDFVRQYVRPHLLLDCPGGSRTEAEAGEAFAEWLSRVEPRAILVADHIFDLLMVLRACPRIDRMCHTAIVPEMGGLSGKCWRQNEIRHHALHDARVLARELAERFQPPQANQSTHHRGMRA